MLICFGNQKGGAGKSTATAIFANYLHLVEHKKVVVVDCDDTQTSIFRKRIRELQSLKEESPDIDVNELVYPVVKKPAKKFAEYYLSELKSQFDYVLVDFPGDITHEGVVSGYALCDVLIVPLCISSELDVESTQIFMSLYKDKIVNLRKEMGLAPQKIYGLLTRIKTSCVEFKDYKAGAQEDYEQIFSFKFLDNYIPDSVDYHRWSSISLYKNANNVCEEILYKLNNK